METKILALVLVVFAVDLASGSLQYPAGVDSRSCPSYPNCDNAALHKALGAIGDSWNSVAAIPAASKTWESDWGSASHWNNAPVANAVPTAAQYPAGVNPQSCPSYPNCDNVALHGGREGVFNPHATAGSLGSAPTAHAAWNPAPNGHPALAPAAPQYPAGVNAESCPNYPYCY